MAHPEHPPAQFQVQLFGPMGVRADGSPLPPLPNRKSLWLLALLILRPDHGADREWLATTLWPDSENALYNLRRALHDLRSALGRQAYRLASSSRQRVQLDPDGAEVDLLDFDATIARGDSASLERAVALYRGSLLEGCLEEWIEYPRARREQEHQQVLESLAGEAMARDDPRAAAGYLRRLLAVDPLRESAHRALMEALAAMGNSAGALHVYHGLERALGQELQIQPDEQTQDLHARIRAGAYARPTTAPAAAAATSSPAQAAAGAGGRTGMGNAGRLPQPLTELIGRVRLAEEVCEKLRRSRLITLVGVGGIGKTRLAIEVARRVAPDHPDGIAFVDLAPLSDGSLVASAVAEALGVIEQPGRAQVDRLCDALGHRRLLLVLDNCEHLVWSCAELAGRLLEVCSELRIMATSRRPLGLYGERTFGVPPLSVPGPPLADTLPANSLRDYEAVRLFEDRAQTVRPDFRVTQENAPAVAAICHQLDGIPLALEMAAARVRALPVGQLAERLNDTFRLLACGHGSRGPRQQTLRSMLDWSYNLLSRREQALLRRLAAFAGGWTLEAAEAVCEYSGIQTSGPNTRMPECLVTGAVLDALTGLVDHSLVILEEGRYQLLETVRQYARDRLMESGEEEEARGRHLDFYLVLAETGEAALRGPEQVEWLARLEAEHDDFRAALAWSTSAPASTSRGAALREMALRLAGALCPFWSLKGHHSEGRRWAEQALARAEALEPTGARSKLLLGVAHVAAWRQGDFTAQQACLEACATLCRDLGDDGGLARALNELGLGTLWHRRDYAAARSLIGDALAIFRQQADRWGIATSLFSLGIVARLQGDYVSARPLYAQGIAGLRELGDRLQLSIPLSHVGVMAMDEGDYDTACSAFEERLKINREVGNKDGVAQSLGWLGQVAYLQQDYAGAEALLQEDLTLQREMGNRTYVAEALAGLGLVAYRQGLLAPARGCYEQVLAIRQPSNLDRAITSPERQPGEDLGQGSIDKYSLAQSLEGLALLEAAQGRFGRAARLLAAAGVLWGDQRESHRRNSHILADPAELEQAAAAARAGLGERAFAAAWAEGRALSLEQAIEYVLCTETGD